ncbi:MAG: hypothetical protein SNG14_00180 [Rikenellaceae bacterium]
MKKFSLFALMLAMTVGMVSLNSCSKDEDDAPSFEGAVAYSGELVGTWEYSEDDDEYDETYTYTITFYSKGSCVMRETEKSDEGTEWDEVSGIFTVADDKVAFVPKKYAWDWLTWEGYDEEEYGPLIGSKDLDVDDDDYEDYCRTFAYKVESGKLSLTDAVYTDDEMILEKK